MLAQQLEGLADAGEHAQRQHVDLEHVQGVEIVLVPLDHGALGHGRVLDRDQLAQGALRDHEAADMLGEVAREAHQLLGQLQCQAQGRIVRVEPGFAQGRLVQALAAVAPDRAAERFLHVRRQAHDLGDLAHRRLGAVADHGGGECGVVATVGPVDPLDHLLAAFMLEVDVDVGRLVALGRDEALEQHVDVRGVDRGDAQCVADDGIGGRAAPLAQDVLAARVLDDVVDGEEVGGVAQLRDQRELVPDQLLNLLRHVVGIALPCPGPGPLLQFLVGGAAVVGGLDRIVVGDLGQREPAALDDLQRALERLRAVPEQARHLRRRLEMALGVGEQEGCRVGDPGMLADAGDHVLQRPAVGMVVVDVVGRERLDAGLVRQSGEPREPPCVVAGIAMGEDEVEVAPPALPQPADQLGERRVRCLGWQQREYLPLVMAEHVVERQGAAAFGGQSFAVGQERAEPGIGRPVGRPAEQRGAADQVEPAADQEAQPDLLGLLVRPDDAGEAVAVGEREAGETQCLGLDDQLLGMRGAPQEAEVGGDLELGVGGHGAAVILALWQRADHQPIDAGQEVDLNSQAELDPPSASSDDPRWPKAMRAAVPA